MKYYNNFLSQSKINITTPIWRTSISSCYVIIISGFVTLISNNLMNIQGLLLDWNFFSSSADKTKFLLKCFYYCYYYYYYYYYYYFAIIILFKNCLNKFTDLIFTSVKKNWLTKSIINSKNFVSKTTRNMILTFFVIQSIIFIITFNSFHITFKISIKFKWKR